MIWWLGWALGFAAVLLSEDDRARLFPHRAFQALLLMMAAAMRAGMQAIGA